MCVHLRACVLVPFLSAVVRIEPAEPGRQECCATVHGSAPDGRAFVRVDNGRRLLVDPRPGNMAPIETPRLSEGARLAVVLRGAMVEATVLRHLGPEHGSRHLLRTDDGDVEYDLNAMNHNAQSFDGGASWAEVRAAYCRQLVAKTAMVLEPVSSTRVHIREQHFVVRRELWDRLDREDSAEVAGRARRCTSDRGPCPLGRTASKSRIESASGASDLRRVPMCAVLRGVSESRARCGSGPQNADVLPCLRTGHGCI